MVSAARHAGCIAYIGVSYLTSASRRPRYAELQNQKALRAADRNHDRRRSRWLRQDDAGQRTISMIYGRQRGYPS